MTDRQSVPYVVFAICAPMLFLQLAETVTLLGADATMGWRNVVRLSVGLLCVGVSVTGFLSMRAGWKRGVVLMAVTGMATIHAMTSYRGAYVWPGTFDLFEFDRWRWLIYPVIAVPVCAAFGALAFRHGPRPLPLWVGFAAAAASLASGLIVWFETAVKHAEGTSEFAPTRQWVYAFLGLASLVALLYARSEEE